MRHSLLLAIAVATSLFVAPPAARSATPPDLKVMSFNIRTGNADQGTPNAWDNRKDIVAQTISDFGADLFGLQEALRYQWQYIEDQFPGFQEVGKSVNDDGTSEYVALFYRKSRFTEINKGNFWLEPNNTPGVTAWDAKFPRMVTWVILQDNQNPSLKFLYMNTHWDNAGVTARLESANMMRAKIQQIAPDLPVIMTGDFNADQGGAAYRRMTGLDNADSYPDYNDTYRQIHPEDSGTVGTSLGFDGKGSNDGRIDWILQGDFTTLDATIDRVSYDGQFPSDHFPITATLAFIPEPASATLLIATAFGFLTSRPKCSRRPV